MSDEKQYAGVVGFVFKEPEDKETTGGKKLRRILVSEANSRNGFFSLTVWGDQHGDVEVNVGDLVAAQGKYEERTKDGTTYKNISCKYFHNLGSGVGNESETTGPSPGASKADDDLF